MTFSPPASAEARGAAWLLALSMLAREVSDFDFDFGDSKWLFLISLSILIADVEVFEDIDWLVPCGSSCKGKT